MTAISSLYLAEMLDHITQICVFSWYIHSPDLRALPLRQRKGLRVPDVYRGASTRTHHRQTARW